MKYGMIQPRSGRYGICGYDVLVVGMECLFFASRKLARKWMKDNGYELVAS
jgi:hypothetical protein